MGMKIIINRQEFAYNMVHQCERIELVGITNQQYWNHAQSKKIVPVKQKLFNVFLAAVSTTHIPQTSLVVHLGFLKQWPLDPGDGPIFPMFSVLPEVGLKTTTSDVKSRLLTTQPTVVEIGPQTDAESLNNLLFAIKMGQSSNLHQPLHVITFYKYLYFENVATFVVTSAATFETLKTKT